MAIAVSCYGEFRSFHLNLLNNLHELFDEVIYPLHFYILTSTYTSDFEEKKQQVISIIHEHNPNNKIMFFESIDTTQFYNIDEEERLVNDYNSIQCPQEKLVFTPRLIYRKFLIDKIINQFDEKYKKVIHVRLFDTVITRDKSLSFINDVNDNNVYYGSCELLIGKQDDINMVCNFNYISDIINHGNDIDEFIEFFKKQNKCLGDILPISCTEWIILSNIYKYFKGRCINLWFDFSNNDKAGFELHETEYKTEKIENIRAILQKYNQNEYLSILCCPYRK
jgi:hypothetical protein